MTHIKQSEEQPFHRLKECSWVSFRCKKWSFLAHISVQINNLSPEVEQARNNALNKKYNAAVGAMERIATRFNVEVKSFRAQDSN